MIAFHSYLQKNAIDIKIATKTNTVINKHLGTSNIGRNRANIYIGSNTYNIVQYGRYYVMCPVNDEIINAQIETYLRNMHGGDSLIIPINDFTEQISANLGYNRVKKSLLEINLIAKPTINLLYKILEWSSKYQIELIKDAIMAASRTKLDTLVIEFYDALGALIHVSDVISTQIASKINVSDYTNTNLKDIIGVFVNKQILILPPTSTEFITFNRLSLGMPIYKENPIQIGFYEQIADKMVFKIRAPFKDIDSTLTDARKIAHGVVCKSLNKRNLEKILSSLDVSERVYESETIKPMCHLLQNRFIELEINSRKSKTNKLSKTDISNKSRKVDKTQTLDTSITFDKSVKYLYSWWDYV
jgi:hypothetical protein